jgi:hypothetical protein
MIQRKRGLRQKGGKDAIRVLSVQRKYDNCESALECQPGADLECTPGAGGAEPNLLRIDGQRQPIV